jgi:hypothetical protein
MVQKTWEKAWLGNRGLGGVDRSTGGGRGAGAVMVGGPCLDPSPAGTGEGILPSKGALATVTFPPAATGVGPAPPAAASLSLFAPLPSDWRSSPTGVMGVEGDLPPSTWSSFHPDPVPRAGVSLHCSLVSRFDRASKAFPYSLASGVRSSSLSRLLGTGRLGPTFAP